MDGQSPALCTQSDCGWEEGWAFLAVTVPETAHQQLGSIIYEKNHLPTKEPEDGGHFHFISLLQLIKMGEHEGDLVNMWIAHGSQVDAEAFLGNFRSFG